MMMMMIKMNSRRKTIVASSKNLPKRALEEHKCALISVEVLLRKVLPMWLNIKQSHQTSFRSSIVSNRIRDKYKAAKSDDECKKKIGSWKGSGYNSQICKK